MMLFVAVLGLFALGANAGLHPFVQPDWHPYTGVHYTDGQTVGQSGLLGFGGMCPNYLRMCFNWFPYRYGYNGNPIDHPDTNSGGWQDWEEELCKYTCAVDDTCSSVTFIYHDRFDNSTYCKHHDNKPELRWGWADASVYWVKSICQDDCFRRYMLKKRIGWKWKSDNDHDITIIDPWRCALKCLSLSWCTGFAYKNTGDDRWKGCYIDWRWFVLTDFEYDWDEKCDYYHRLDCGADPEIIYPVAPEYAANVPVYMNLPGLPPPPPAPPGNPNPGNPNP